MENLQQFASPGLHRENESMDDFEHLEAESTSPVKETSYDKVLVKDAKSDNLKSEKEASIPSVMVPGESRNSSDFSMLSDSKLDSPVADNNSVFTMEDTAKNLEELTSSVENRKSPVEQSNTEFVNSHIPESSVFSKFEPKSEETVLQSFLANEKFGSGYDVLRDGTGVSANVDLLKFESNPFAEGDQTTDDIQGKHIAPALKEDEDSFKDTIPEVISSTEKLAIHPTEENQPIDLVMEDTFKDVIQDAAFDIKEPENTNEEVSIPKYRSEEVSIPKYRSEHEDEDQEEFNLAASPQKTTGMFMTSTRDFSDMLEQYNMKPTKDVVPKVEKSETSLDDEQFEFEREKVVSEPAASGKEEVTKEMVHIPPEPITTTKKPESPVALSTSVSLPLDSWFNPEKLHPRVESLLYWRNPKVSGIVLVAGLVPLLTLSYCSLISVIAYLSLGVLLGCGGFRLYRVLMAAVNKTGEGHPFRDLLDIDIAISSDRAASLAQQIVPQINASVSVLRSLFLVEDILYSFKFGVLLWALTYIGDMFNGLTLVILAFVSAFTLPRLYENNKEQIDKNVELAQAKFAEITAKVQALNPLSGGAAKKLTGSEEKKEN